MLGGFRNCHFQKPEGRRGRQDATHNLQVILLQSKGIASPALGGIAMTAIEVFQHSACCGSLSI